MYKEKIMDKDVEELYNKVIPADMRKLFELAKDRERIENIERCRQYYRKHKNENKSL